MADPVRSNVGAYRPLPVDRLAMSTPEVALAWLDKLLEMCGGASLAHLETLGPGECHDCGPGTTYRRRYLYGETLLELCRRHATVRDQVKP